MIFGYKKLKYLKQEHHKLHIPLGPEQNTKAPSHYGGVERLADSRNFEKIFSVLRIIIWVRLAELYG